MLKLQYELGYPINLYMDRPNIYLGALVDINVRLFVIGQYKGEIPSCYRKISLVTPDIQPHIVLSQTKLENFETLGSIANDYNAKFIHYEMNFLPQKISPKSLANLKNIRAPINIFTDPFIRDLWEFDQSESLVIENSAEELNVNITKAPYHISQIIPLAHMAKEICPIILKTPYSNSVITNGLNGFLYSNQSELSFIINKLQKMDKEDVQQIGKNAKELVLGRFKKGAFLEKWQTLIRNII